MHGELHGLTQISAGVVLRLNGATAIQTSARRCRAATVLMHVSCPQPCNVVRGGSKPAWAVVSAQIFTVDTVFHLLA